MSTSISTVIDVRLFGALELESEQGCLVESRGDKPRLFLLLKYLLLEPQREVDQEEVLQQVWNDRPVVGCTGRVRLRRLRETLEFLQPEGGNSLINFQAGKYSLNPDYTLRFDTDVFLSLLKQSENFSLTDPEGLKLCQDALELFRGPLLEYTKNAPWLTGYRNYYLREFIRLGREMLKRMRAMNVTEPVQPLCSQALMLVPEDETLHRDIIEFLMDNQLGKELIQHVKSLISTDKAKWLYAVQDPKLKEMTGCEELSEDPHIVHIKLFGDVELRNIYGHLIENRSRTPFLLLKYLLMNPRKEITTDEILQLWPPMSPDSNPQATVTIRLTRARSALEPLKLNKKTGLISYHKGIYKINPSYILKRDVDEFGDILSSLPSYNLNDPEGLKACMDALELFRAPLMAYTKSAPWLEEYRSRYRDEFCRLTEETLNRMKALGTDEALPLLTQRAVDVAPECQELHEPIIQYLTEQKKELEMIRYLSSLSRTGKANWIGKPLLV